MRSAQPQLRRAPRDVIQRARARDCDRAASRLRECSLALELVTNFIGYVVVDFLGGSHLARAPDATALGKDVGVNDGESAYDDSKFYEQEGNPRTTSARDYTYTTEGLAKPPPWARFPARDDEVENI